MKSHHLQSTVRHPLTLPMQARQYDLASTVQHDRAARRFDETTEPPPAIPWTPVDFPGLFRTDDPTRLTPAAAAQWRQRLFAYLPTLHCPVLARFVQKAFEDDLMVDTYHHLKSIRTPVGQAFAKSGCPLLALPIQEAKRAAVRACRTEGLPRREWEFIYVAALLFPCGLFHLSHPHAITQSYVLTGLDQARGLTGLLLEDALRDLCRQDPARGEAMAALLAFGHTGDCDPTQMARLGSVLHLSQQRINDIWLEPADWN